MRRIAPVVPIIPIIPIVLLLLGVCVPLRAQGDGSTKVGKDGQQTLPTKAAVEDVPEPDRDPGFDFSAFSDSAGKPKADPRNLQGGPFGDRLDLTTPWLFHGGAEPGAASPGYDDRTWQVLDTSRPMFSSMVFNQNEVWYRVHVRLAPGVHDLALAILDFGGSYRVFANGVEIGGHGRMTGRGDYLIVASDVESIPDAAVSSALAPVTAVGSSPAAGLDSGLASAPQPLELVLAIHGYVGNVDRATFTLKDGLTRSSRVYLGPRTVLARDGSTTVLRGSGESTAVLTLWAVLLFLAAALAFLIPRTPIYGLLAMYAGGHILERLLDTYAQIHFLPQTHWLELPIHLAAIASQIALLEICRILAGTRRRVWFRALEVVYVLAQASLVPAALGLLPLALYTVVQALGTALLLGTAVVLILVGVRRRHHDAYALAATAAVFVLHSLFWELLHYVVFSFAVLTQVADWYQRTFVPLETINFAIVIGFATLLLMRTLRIVRERASIASEIEAARTMQQLLLTQSNQATPGFVVESVYLPAGEVGGDFFLVSPCKPEEPENLLAGSLTASLPASLTGSRQDSLQDTSLTVIVGDVSGKGLRAAMRVSMILGVLRREPSREPAAMLRGLNAALHAEGDSGFTTACCLRLARDGRYSVANAGHLSPYVVGSGRSQELATSPALPLGLVEDQAYDVVHGRLLPGQRLVMLSDGVAEARSAKGELYGFDRLGPLTLRTATEIASTAQRFGQDDDITVLTIACEPRTTSTPPPPAPPPPLVRTPVAPPPYAGPARASAG